ncbi:site-2 protease family protein [Ralstonia solanacearum]|uniref:site-2 protease family protein n=1 Tax=Ralstonia solanacearum TaxID=305 RepID=UPI0018D0F285|nr:site-2 protease family protein [Ralstonia solanacearum]
MDAPLSMYPFYLFIAALAACSLLHVTMFALTGEQLGVAVREVSFGFGPTIARFGKVRIKALPFGGYVRLKDSRVEPFAEHERADALDTQPIHVQTALILSGSAYLLGVALTTLRLDAVGAFADSFVQIVGGALSPTGYAQTLLSQAHQAISQLPFFALLGLVAAKTAAFNLLPFPNTNGGALLATLARDTWLARVWPKQLTKALLFVYLAVIVSWLGAFLLHLGS